MCCVVVFAHPTTATTTTTTTATTTTTTTTDYYHLVYTTTTTTTTIATTTTTCKPTHVCRNQCNHINILDILMMILEHDSLQGTCGFAMRTRDTCKMQCQHARRSV